MYLPAAVETCNIATVVSASTESDMQWLQGLSASLESYLHSSPKALLEPSRFHLNKPGKRIRARLAFHCAKHLGLPDNTCISWALAVDLLHNASLVHDDLCDGDTRRRGQETIAKRFGDPVALCCGDFFIATAFKVLADLNASTQLIQRFAVQMQHISGGQAAEFMLVGYPGWREYQAIAIDKTAPLLSLPVVGAFDLAAIRHPTARVERYFTEAALCFQIINDLRNFNGSDGASSPCSDLTNCRPNAVLANFREGLAKRPGMAFDQWADRVRASAICVPISEAREWWQQVKASSAFAKTQAELDRHFQLASYQLQQIAPELEQYLAPFNEWLSREMAQIREHFR